MYYSPFTPITGSLTSHMQSSTHKICADSFEMHHVDDEGITENFFS